VVSQSDPSETLDPRLLVLEGPDNARDLGGLPLADGGRVRPGELLRAELPHALTAGDLDVLRDAVGLRTVVDLRTRSEVRGRSVEWVGHGIAWVHCPFDLAGHDLVPRTSADYPTIYLAYLDRPAPVALAVATLIGPAARPALFHCAAGKDRTGVLGALLLDLLGVPREAIGADYELTAAAIGDVLGKLKEIEPYDRYLADLDPSHHAPVAASIIAFLDRVDERFGGSERWLLDHAGVDRDALARFRGDLRE
jgi:protein tyrosine/serine phosphatase